MEEVLVEPVTDRQEHAAEDGKHDPEAQLLLDVRLHRPAADREDEHKRKEIDREDQPGHHAEELAEDEFRPADRFRDHRQHRAVVNFLRDDVGGGERPEEQPGEHQRGQPHVA